MARIILCDRCREEIRGESGVHNLTTQVNKLGTEDAQTEYELCSGCFNGLIRYLTTPDPQAG